MQVMALVALYGAVAAYSYAALAAFAYLRNQEDRTMATANRVMAGGAILLLIFFVIRGLQWGHLPLTSGVDAIALFVLLSSAVVGVMIIDDRFRPLQCYYAPPLAFMAMATGLVALRSSAVEPKPLNEAFLAVHVGLAFLSYALFFIASLTSVAYFVQVNRLKRHRTTGLFHRMPSLEVLDQRLVRLIVAGYPLFIVTLVLGAYYATSGQTDQLSEYWWQSPKIIMSLITVLFYGAAVHGRQFGLLRGRKLAYFLFYGFATLLLIQGALVFLNLRRHNFWEVGA
jgi:HemX protein